MKTVGSYQAKTHLAQLLKKVARGERIVITRKGLPIALLTPAPSLGKSKPKEVIEKIRVCRKGVLLGDLSIQEMRHKGRRF
jgi:prevent-host-death family protein